MMRPFYYLFICKMNLLLGKSMRKQPRELSLLFVLVGRAQFPHPQFCTLPLGRGGPLQGFQALQPLPSLTAADQGTVERRGGDACWQGRIHS